MAGLPGAQAQMGLKRGIPRPESLKETKVATQRSHLRFRAPQTFGVFQSAGGLLETQIPGPPPSFWFGGSGMGPENLHP